jgi:hypothetical protein
MEEGGMKERLKKDEAWIRARLPAELVGEDIFSTCDPFPS